MPIQWRDALNVGHPMVDSDHRHLVDLINSFEQAIQGEIDHKAIARILLGLFDYTGEHFEREEKLQLTIRYPFNESHRRAHRDVLRELNEILERYGNEKDLATRDKMVRGMVDFLRNWLINHIIESDLRMKPYIADYLRQQRAKRHKSEVKGE